MTAEIAIMNKGAIALAADSAVTLGEGQKIFQTAEKLFRLSKYHPVGIMVFGNAEFMGVPWETIIKVYCGTLGQQSFASLEDYTTHFIRFLEDQNPLFPEAQQEAHVRRAPQVIFGDEIREQIVGWIQSEGESGKKLNERKVSAIVDHVIGSVCQQWEADPELPGIPPDYGRSVVERYSATFDKARDTIFEDLPLSRASRERIRRIASCMFSKGCFHPVLKSGAVIAGFGEAEPFPSLLSFDIEAIVNKRLKYAGRDRDQISFEDPEGAIRAFAQGEMVQMFMEGVDPDYHDELENRQKELLGNYRRRLLATLRPLRTQGRHALVKRWESIGNELLNQLNDRLQKYRNNHYVAPVMDAVAALPKRDLAVMAEAMVWLTVLKRRMSTDVESVAGSIDVAVISKGDGFVWVKRKQYARQDLNPDLFGGA